MTLRRLDAAGRRALIDDLNPRFLALDVRTERVTFRWWVPMWAIEEPLRFLLHVVPLVAHLARHRSPSLVRRWPRLAHALDRLGVASDPGAAEPGARTSLYDRIDVWFSEADRDLLVMPDGQPFVRVDTKGADLVIEERRLPWTKRIRA